jgi:hypothetical protein
MKRLITYPLHRVYAGRKEEILQRRMEKKQLTLERRKQYNFNRKNIGLNQHQFANLILEKFVHFGLKINSYDVKTGSVYDYGYALDLNSDGLEEYALYCEESPHGPCGMKIFGKVYIFSLRKIFIISPDFVT